MTKRKPEAKASHTYDDWWKGRVYLETSTGSFKKDVQLFYGVMLDVFTQADAAKIKAKQAVLYKASLRSLTTTWKADFKERFSNSQLPHVLLDRELRVFHAVMFQRVSGSGRVSLVEKPMSFAWQDFQDIQKWIKDVVIEGGKIDYGFMHSPNFPHQESTKTPSPIYAHACWEYYNWLKTLLPRQKTQSNRTSKRKSPVRLNKLDHEPYNGHVFINRRSEKVFEDFCIAYADDMKRKKMAILSFIYWKMVENSLVHPITPVQFRNFLSRLPANYALEKLKTLQSCASPDKQKVFEVCKAKYFG